MASARLIKVVLAIALVSVALSAQQPATPINDAPNPYRTVENHFKMPPGRTWGSTSAVEIDRDGRSIWVAERCGADTCNGSDLDTVMEFDASGALGAELRQGPDGVPPRHSHRSRRQRLGD